MVRPNVKKVSEIGRLGQRDLRVAGCNVSQPIGPVEVLCGMDFAGQRSSSALNKDWLLAVAEGREALCSFWVCFDMLVKNAVDLQDAVVPALDVSLALMIWAFCLRILRLSIAELRNVGEDIDIWRRESQQNRQRIVHAWIRINDKLAAGDHPIVSVSNG